MNKITKRTLSAIAALGFLWVSAGPANAATAVSALNVSATVISSCSVKSVTSIAFGNYDPTNIAAPTDAAGGFTFKCTKNTPYDLYITGVRSMTDGTDTLTYELYTDLARTTLWPAATPGVTGTSVSNADDIRNVYGRIPAVQNVGAGAYNGSVTVTVQY